MSTIWQIYLSGEIHSDWREQIMAGTKAEGLPAAFSAPVTHHEASDDCGVAILGQEDNKFWHDHKGAQMNAIRTRTLIEKADVVVVRFGEKYKQWNAAFDAGYAAALGKPIIVVHGPERPRERPAGRGTPRANAPVPAQYSRPEEPICLPGPGLICAEL